MADINVIVLPDGTEYPVSDHYLPVAISNPTDGQVLKYDATNHVWYNGDDAEGSSVFYGTSAPTSQLGVNGNLYVKYTEGTGGASDTVDALYVKLDGAWCQISTGGGGGTSDYSDLTNKPQINSVELSGNKSLDDLGIQPSEIGKTATGSIITFSDGGDNIPVESFECEIVARQESGTPTPANPLLISGFDSADMPVSGINIFDEQIETGTLNNSTGETGVDDNKRRSANFIPVKPNTTYSVYNNTGVNLYIYSYGIDKSFIAFDNTGMVTGSTFTTDSNTYYIKFRTQNNLSYDNNISINYPSTDVQYHPYTGTIYSIDFGQTIYGGKLVYANGKWFIRATHEMVDLGDLDWNYQSSGSDVAPYFYTTISGVKYRGTPFTTLYDIMCEKYKPTKRTVDDFIDECITFDGTTTAITQMQIKDSTYTDPAIFKTSLNGVKLVYELATPVIIPLTSSAKIKTLSGVNNIFSNTGDSTLKYFTNDADGIEELIDVSETSAKNTTIDDTNLAYEANNAQEAFEKITKSLTWAEYQALSEEEKNNGTIYLITDVNGDGQNFQPIIYSEEEHEIGVWTDGKPLYEKTISLTNVTIPVSGGYSYSISDLNIDAVIAGPYGFFTVSNETITIPFDILGSYGVEAYATKTTVIFVRKSVDITCDKLVFTIRYTKTTDQPGSGTWTPQGVPAVHYSEDEHVVGTWIDGSTLYEKTIYIPNLPNNADIEYETGLSNVVQRGFDAHILFPSGNISKLPYINAANNNRVAIQFNANGKIQILTQYNNSGNAAYVTIRYTKSS